MVNLAPCSVDSTAGRNGLRAGRRMGMEIWVIRNGELTRWRRTGECNSCGDCCKGMLSYQMQVAIRDDAGAPGASDNDWSDFEGWSAFLSQGIWWWFKVEQLEGGRTCGDLDCIGGKHFCTTWQDSNTFRPICRYWPFHPDHLEWFPRCSFEMEELECRV